MGKNTRTATITTGLITSIKALKTLLGSTLASKEEVFRDVTIENQGSLDLVLYAMDKNSATPADADGVTIVPGQTESFDRISSSYFYIGLTSFPGGGAEPTLPSFYQIKFVGTPVTE